MLYMYQNSAEEFRWVGLGKVQFSALADTMILEVRNNC